MYAVNAGSDTVSVFAARGDRLLLRQILGSGGWPCSAASAHGRSSLRTWLFAILVNRARTTGVKERRNVAVADPAPAVEAARFDGTGHWVSPPEQWLEEAENRAQAAKIADRIRSAIDELPGRQRQVVTVRDIEGMTSEEVRSVLDISEINQRVLLHRGRSRLPQHRGPDPADAGLGAGQPRAAAGSTAFDGCRAQEATHGRPRELKLS